MNNQTKIALTIFKKTLENDTINSNVNQELYDEYRYDSNISNEVDEILEVFNMEIYDNPNEGLFLTSGVNNSIFGYSNEDLRKELKVKTNKELSVCLYLMYCILSKFYKESSLIPTAEFITSSQLIEDADTKMLAIKTMLEQREEDEEQAKDDNFESSFKKLVDTWDDISLVNIKSKAKDISKDERSETKIAFANKTLKFFSDNNLLAYSEIQDIYMITSKLSTLVGYYYDTHKNRNEITEYLDSLYE